MFSVVRTTGTVGHVSAPDKMGRNGKSRYKLRLPAERLGTGTGYSSRPLGMYLAGYRQEVHNLVKC